MSSFQDWISISINMQSRVALFGPQINDGTYMSVRHVLPDLDLICNVYCLVKFMLSFPNTSVTLYILPCNLCLPYFVHTLMMKDTYLCICHL